MSAIAAENARTDVPAGGLLHPIAVVSIAAMVVNDHWLKAAWPGLVTGKLSDILGLVFFPLFVQALWELASWVLRRWRGPDRRVLWIAVALTALGFTLIQVWPWASDLYRVGLGVLQQPFLSAVAGEWLPIQRVQLTPDPTDLLALPALAIPLWLGTRR